MSSEVLLSNIIPFAGSGLLGYAMGFALKKILKWMLVIVGFLAGMFFVGVQLLQKYGYVTAVNWDKLGNDTSTQIQHLAANIDLTNVHSIFHTLGIPVSGGLGLGFLAGFVRTRQ
ncbi:MAG: FUN14 domain-containing protein [Candidatus Nitrosopolaris sp.]